MLDQNRFLAHFGDSNYRYFLRLENFDYCETIFFEKIWYFCEVVISKIMYPYFSQKFAKKVRIVIFRQKKFSHQNVLCTKRLFYPLETCLSSYFFIHRTLHPGKIYSVKNN